MSTLLTDLFGRSFHYDYNNYHVSIITLMSYHHVTWEYYYCSYWHSRNYVTHLTNYNFVNIPLTWWNLKLTGLIFIIHFYVIIPLIFSFRYHLLCLWMPLIIINFLLGSIIFILFWIIYQINDLIVIIHSCGYMAIARHIFPTSLLAARTQSNLLSKLAV